MLLLWFVAHAGEVAPWIAAVESEVDAARASIQSCVTFTHAVDADYPELARFELVYPRSGPARVVAKEATFEEVRVSACIADALSTRPWPTPPHRPAAAGFTLNITGEASLRRDRAFLAHPMPAAMAETAALNVDAMRIFTSRIRLGKRCLQARTSVGGEDISARLEIAFTLSAEGRLVPGAVAGGSYDPALRECVLTELAKVAFPVGYVATPPFSLSVEMDASRSGGELWSPYVGGGADGGWRWRTQVRYLGRRDTRPKGQPESDPVRWLYLGQRALSAARRNVQGCVLADPTQRADYELLMVAGPGGLEEVVVATTSGAAMAAKCVAREVQEAGLPALSSRVVIGTRVEVLTGPSTVFSGLAPLSSRPGRWDAALIEAVRAGDADAFAAALPAGADRIHGDWSTAELVELPPVSWRFAGDWPAWDRLVVSHAPIAEAERHADHWAAEATGCVPKPTAGQRTGLLVAMHVDAAGVVHVDPPIHNSSGSDAARCVEARIAGQTLGRSSVALSAFWLARP